MGYHVYKLLEKNIFTNRDIIFHESSFLFASTLHVSPSSQSSILSHIVDNGDEPTLFILSVDLHVYLLGPLPLLIRILLKQHPLI